MIKFIILGLIIWTVIVYLVASFIAMDINAANWHSAGRLMLTLVWSMGSCVISAIALEYEK